MDQRRRKRRDPGAVRSRVQVREVAVWVEGTCTDMYHMSSSPTPHSLFPPTFSSREKHTQFCRGKADLSEMGLDFSQFWWVCLEFCLKARIAKSIHAFQCDRVLTNSTEFIACHDKSIRNFLTCSVCLLMVGSECVWGLGEDSNFQLVRGPQKLSFRQKEQFDPKFCRKLCKL